MQRSVDAAGVRAIPTQFGSRWDEIETWVAAHLPVVVKPPMSSGTDHVFICTTLEQARNAFDAIMAKPNTFGEINRGAVVQTKVEGTEYIVNHVSCDGRHYVTDIWRVDKVRGGRPVYDRGVLLPSQGEVQDAMVEYVTSILDALAIRFGPSHCELMLTENGPILIEIAARMHGQSPQPLCEKVMGFSQVTATLDAYLAPAKFYELAAAPYVLHEQLQRVELICPRSGLLRSLPRLDDIRAMPSFYKLKLYVEPGQRIVETTDLMSIPGFIDLIHPDPEVIERDHQQLRTLELADFYDVVAD